MNDHERIDLLERRVEALESELRATRRLLAEFLRRAPDDAVAAPTGDRSPPRASKGSVVTRALKARDTVAASKPRASTGATEAEPHARDLEAWIGQNALLAIGAVALVLTVGFGLKYAFDEGWISPAVRVFGGLLFGTAVALYGEHLLRRGLGRFGAGLLGAGAAIDYLSLWAAAGPYRFVPAFAGIGALVLLAVLVFLASLRHGRQELAVFAAVGAYIAPLLLGTGQSAETLLVYSGLVSAAGGAAAWRHGWRTAFSTVVLGFFLMGLVGAGSAASDASLTVYLVAGTMASALGAGSRGWHGIEVAAAVIGWYALAMVAGAGDEAWGWLYALGPVALAVAFALPVARGAPLDSLLGASGRPAEGRPAQDLFLFAFAVTAWDAIVVLAFDETSETIAAWVLLAIGAAWIGWSLKGRIPEFLVAAVATWCVAAWSGLDAPYQPAAWGALGLIAVLLSRGESLSLARPFSPALLAMSALRMPELLNSRAEGDPAFVGTWPLVAGAVLLSCVLAAGPAWTVPDRRVRQVWGISLRTTVWTIAGVLLLYVGTVEIQRFLTQMDAPSLASGFAVSAWWLVYAGSLLAWGFLHDAKVVRIAGLAVGGLALAKVVLHDMAALDALYRVGSFALLAGVALLAARAYHRRAHPDGTEDGRSAIPDQEG